MVYDLVYYNTSTTWQYARALSGEVPLNLDIAVLQDGGGEEVAVDNVMHASAPYQVGKYRTCAEEGIAVSDVGANIRGA